MKTENKRLWFELDEKTGELHMDSLDPKTGGQVPMWVALRAWRLMTDLLMRSHELQSKDPRVSMESKAWARSVYEKLQRAMREVFPDEGPPLSNVGIRRTWET